MVFVLAGGGLAPCKTAAHIGEALLRGIKVIDHTHNQAGKAVGGVITGAVFAFARPAVLYQQGQAAGDFHLA